MKKRERWREREKIQARATGGKKYQRTGDPALIMKRLKIQLTKNTPIGGSPLFRYRAVRTGGRAKFLRNARCSSTVRPSVNFRRTTAGRDEIALQLEAKEINLLIAELCARPRGSELISGFSTHPRERVYDAVICLYHRTATFSPKTACPPAKCAFIDDK